MTTSVINALLAGALIVLFAWRGMTLIAKPREWLIRHGRDTGEKHILATRFIGWMFLVVVGLMILQLIRSHR